MLKEKKKKKKKGTEIDSSASSDVDFDDYGEFGYQLEPEYTEEELRQMEEAASAQRREIGNNPRQNDTNWCSCSKCISLPLRQNASAAMNFHYLMANWNPVTALPITPTLEQFVSTLLGLEQAILVF